MPRSMAPKVLFHYPMLMYSVAVVKSACFEHSNFFTVNDLGPGAFKWTPPMPPSTPPQDGTHPLAEMSGHPAKGRTATT